MTYLWPPCCVVCSSRRLATYYDGTWTCLTCGADSTDTADHDLATEETT